MVPVETAENIGLRRLISREEGDKVLRYILSGVASTGASQSGNWNRRYRENMARIKSGDLFEVARVVKGLMLRDVQKGLSTGERKMLHSAKQILISEIVMCQSSSYEDVEACIDHALA